MSTWTELAGTSGLGAAFVMLVQAAAKWLRSKALAARVRKEAAGGPEFGTIGWVWNEVSAKVSEVRSKGHTNERIINAQAERIAALETAVFGASRMPSGEQERLDYNRERYDGQAPLSAPRRLPEADTEPEPLPPMRDSRSTIRRSRP